MSGTSSLRRSAIAAVAILFAINGTFMGVWGGSLPGLKDKLGIDDGNIALLLVLAGGTAALTMQIAGHVSDRTGARLPTYVGALGQVVGLALIAFAPSFGFLLLAAVVFGGFNGVMDVSMNYLAVHAEQNHIATIMSRMHACWSIGAFAGSMAVVAFRSVVPDPGERVPYPIGVIAVVGLVGLASIWRPILDSRPTHDDATPTRSKLPRAVWLLAAMALCFGLTEGTGFDWAAIHTTDVARVDPGVGALGLSAMAITMFVVRMLGDWAVATFGRRTVVRVGAVIAACAYLLASIVTALPLVLVSWGLVGFGVALLAPQIYGLAGHLGGPRMLARVTAAGYTAFLAGPALIGWASSQFGIQRAMLIPLVTAFGLVVMSLSMPVLPGEDHRP